MDWIYRAPFWAAETRGMIEPRIMSVFYVIVIQDFQQPMVDPFMCKFKSQED